MKVFVLYKIGKVFFLIDKVFPLGEIDKAFVLHQMGKVFVVCQIAEVLFLF